MLNKVNRNQELHRVNVLLRALSAEIEEERAHLTETSSSNALVAEMKEAMYELRLKKLLFSAMGSDRRTEKTISH